MSNELPDLDEFLNGLAMKPSVSVEEEEDIWRRIDTADSLTKVDVRGLLDAVLELEHRE